MTTVTRTNLKCACGHQGRIVMRENDAPFSRQYEDYSLDGLKGDSYSVLDRFAKWDEVFREMKPVCPECGSKLTEDNIEADLVQNRGPESRTPPEGGADSLHVEPSSREVRAGHPQTSLKV